MTRITRSASRGRRKPVTATEVSPDPAPSTPKKKDSRIPAPGSRKTKSTAAKQTSTPTKRSRSPVKKSTTDESSAAKSSPAKKPSFSPRKKTKIAVDAQTVSTPEVDQVVVPEISAGAPSSTSIDHGAIVSNFTKEVKKIVGQNSDLTQSEPARDEDDNDDDDDDDLIDSEEDNQEDDDSSSAPSEIISDRIIENFDTNLMSDFREIARDVTNEGSGVSLEQGLAINVSARASPVKSSLAKEGVVAEDIPGEGASLLAKKELAATTSEVVLEQAQSIEEDVAKTVAQSEVKESKSEEKVVEKKVEAVKVVPKRPAFKRVFTQFLRQKLDAKKGSDEVVLTEDAGLSKHEDPMGFKMSFTNKTIVSYPIKARLYSVAQVLGFTGVSIGLHCVIFMVSFWFCTLLTTYYMPSSEDEKVNFWYQMMTQKKVDSLGAHLKEYERWLVWPKFQPEVLAMMLTICISTVLAKLRRTPAEDRDVKTIPLIKLC